MSTSSKFSPLIHVRDGLQGGAEAVDVVGHVTLVTHNLLLGVLLPSTFVASTFLALATRKIFAVRAIRCILSCIYTEFHTLQKE